MTVTSASAPAQTPAAAGTTITPDATVGGRSITITATGLQDRWFEFDIGSIFDMGYGYGPYSYILFFNAGGTISFSRAVTLTKYEFDWYTYEEIVLERNVSAGETIAVNATLNAYAISLDNGDTIVIVFGPDPGDYAGIYPDRSFNDFPGTVSFD